MIPANLPPAILTTTPAKRRGRPRRVVPLVEADHGTPELRRKKQLHLTTEPLDWLRGQEYISPQQHWCGLHFRWLYTLRYGAVTVQSLDASYLRGSLPNTPESSEWQAQREEEWQQAITALEQWNLLSTTLAICIYWQETPASWRRGRKLAPLVPLREALGILEKLWCKGRSFHLVS